MDYATLIAQHDAIDSAAMVVLAFTRFATPQPAAASHALGLLAALVRDHLAAEDPVIYETVIAVRGTRHGEVAALAAEELDALKNDWTRYLYRWDGGAIAADWSGFAADSQAMLDRLRERVKRETAILYSLAHYHAIIG